jgi:hypothetical protein
MVARAVPPASRRKASAGVLLGSLASAALVAFAAVGVIATGVSLADSLQGWQSSGSDAGEHQADTVDCYLGDASVEVAAEVIGVSDELGAVIAYCFGTVDAGSADRAGAISCARSVASAEEARQRAESGETPPPGAVDPTYLGACTRVVDVEVADLDPDDGDLTGPGPSVPLLTWDRAESTAGWPVLRPGWLPAGYELAALQGFGSADETGAIATVSATYLRAGNALTVEQFVLPEAEAFRIELNIPGDQLQGVSTGQTSVGDHAAFWADGVVATAGGPGFDVDALVLTWAHDGIGYRITSRFDDLDALRRVGDSLTGG